MEVLKSSGGTLRLLGEIIKAMGGGGGGVWGWGGGGGGGGGVFVCGGGTQRPEVKYAEKEKRSRSYPIRADLSLLAEWVSGGREHETISTYGVGALTRETRG